MLDTAIERWRRREETLWRSRVRIERPEGERVFDEEDGTYTEPDRTVIYEGPGQVRSFKWEGADTQVGQQEVRIRGARAKVPANTPVNRGDVLTVTECRYDADLVDQVFRVTDVERDDWQIVRRLILEETT